MDQRLDSSGSAAECFLNRTTRIPGVAHLPTAPRDSESLRAARASSRDAQVKRTQSQRKPETFYPGQSVLVQNNLTKLWNIKARVLSRRLHQGIQTNSYILKAQKTGRQLVRSERNIRPVAKAMSSPTGSDTDLDSDTHASTVLCSNPVSVFTHPASILKTHNEGPWLSPTQHASTPTTGDPALNALSALKTSPLPQPGASTRHRTPPRTRRV